MMEAADNTTGTITTTAPITSIVTHAFSMRSEKQQQSYDIRESFSPDLVLQRRLQESQQSMHFNDGMTSARFNNYQESEEESSRRRRNKRIKPRALEVSDFSAGRGQNSTSRNNNNNSNLNSQRNFLNSHRTNQSGLSSRGGNSMQNSGNGEMLSSTVVKDKHADRSEGNSNCVSPFSAREVKAAQSAYLSNIEEVSEQLPQSKRQQHAQQQQQQQCSGLQLNRQCNYINDESCNNHVISPISPGMNSLGIRDYPEFQLLTQSEQYQRHGYSSDGSTRARKLVSQPSLRQFNHVNAYEESRQQQQLLQQPYQASAAILERKSSVYGIDCEEEMRASGKEAILNEGLNHRTSSSNSRIQFQHQNKPNQQHFHIPKQSQGQIEQSQIQFYQHPQQYLPHFSNQQQQQQIQHSQYVDQAQFVPALGLHQTWEQQPSQDYQQSQYQQIQQPQVLLQLSYPNIDEGTQYVSDNHINQTIPQNTQLDSHYISDQPTIVSNQYPLSNPQYCNLLQQRAANHSDRHSYPNELGSSMAEPQDILPMRQSNSNRNSQERNTTKNLEDNIKNSRNSIGTTRGCGIASLPAGNSSLKLTSDLLNASGLVYTEEHGDRVLAVSRQNTLETMSNSGMRKQGLEISSLEISSSNHNNERYLAESKEEDEGELDENAEIILQQSQTSNNSHNQKIMDRLSMKQSQQSAGSSKSPLRECTQRLNNSMGELTGAKQQKIALKISNSSSFGHNRFKEQIQNGRKDANSCRSQFNRDSENDSDKENLHQSAQQLNSQDDKLSSGSQQKRTAKPRASSSSFRSQATPIDQAEYEQIFKLLIHERDRNSSLETQLRENNQTIHLLRQTITENIAIQQSQRNYQDVLRQKEEQLSDLQRTAEELRKSLQEINQNNQQLLQEKLLLVEQNTQLLDQNRELKRRSQENELKVKVLEGESQNGNSNERKKENVKKEQDLGSNKDRRKSQILEEQTLKNHSNSHNNGCTFQTEDETSHNLSSAACSTAYKTNQSSLKTNTTAANAVTITSSNFYKGSQNTNTHSSVNNTSNNHCNATPTSNNNSNIRRADGNRIDGDIDSCSQNQQSFLDISYTKKPKSPRNNSHSSSETNQFIACVLGMIEQCAPAGSFTESQPNNLKRSWKILKQIIENYIVLKKTALNNVNSLEILCSSAKILGLENVDMLPNALERLVERSNRDRAQCKVYCEKLRRLQHALSYIQENQCNLLDYNTAEDDFLDRSSFTVKSHLGKGEKDNSLGNREMDYLHNQNQQRLELKRNEKKQNKNQDYELIDNSCSNNNEGELEYDCVNRKSNNLSHRNLLIGLDHSQDGNFTFKSMNVRQYNEPAGVALKKNGTPRACMINNHSPNNTSSFITNDQRPEYNSNRSNDAELSRRSKQPIHESQQNSGRNRIPNQHKAIEDSLDNSLIEAIMPNQNTQGQFGNPRRTSSAYSPAGQTISSNKTIAYNQHGRINEKQQEHAKDPSCGFSQFQEEPQQHGFRTIQPQKHWQQQQQQHQQILSYGLEEINGNMDNSSFHKRRQSSASTTSPLARPPTHKHKQTTLKNANIANSSFIV